MDTWLWRDVALAVGAALLGGALTLLLRMLWGESRVKQVPAGAEWPVSPPPPPRPPGLTQFLAATAAAAADTAILAPAADPLPVAQTTAEPDMSTPNPQAVSASSVTLALDSSNVSVAAADDDVTVRSDLPQATIPPPPAPTQADLIAAERLARRFASNQPAPTDPPTPTPDLSAPVPDQPVPTPDPPAQLYRPVPSLTTGRTAGPNLPQVRQRDLDDPLGTGSDFARPASVWRPPTTRFLASLVSEPSQARISDATVTVAISTVGAES